MEFPNTGESGLLSVCPGIRTQKSGQCAGRRHGLEAGTDPQTIVAGGKGSFSWVTGIFCVNLFFIPPLSPLSLPLPSSLLFHFGLTSCSLLHFRPRRLITSKEPLKLIS